MIIRIKDLWYCFVAWYYRWRYPIVQEHGLTRAEAKLCVGKGWSGLVDQVYDICEVHDIVVSDVKQKFAQLRVGWWWPNTNAEVTDTDVDGVIQALLTIEDTSYTICEECGQLGTWVRVNGWEYTLCNTCKEKLEAAK